MNRNTLLQNVINLFRSRPGEWINGIDLARVGGQFAFRTRISEARRIEGMDIANRTRRVKLAGGSHVFTVTEYRFVPPSQPAQAELFSKEDASAA